MILFAVPPVEGDSSKIQGALILFTKWKIDAVVEMLWLSTLQWLASQMSLEWIYFFADMTWRCCLWDLRHVTLPGIVTIFSIFIRHLCQHYSLFLYPSLSEFASGIFSLLLWVVVETVRIVTVPWSCDLIAFGLSQSSFFPTICIETQ